MKFYNTLIIGTFIAVSACTPNQTQDWLTKISEDRLVETAGNGANEIRNWIVMHAATDFAADKTLAYSPCLLYTSPSPRDRQKSRMPSSA